MPLSIQNTTDGSAMKLLVRDAVGQAVNQVTIRSDLAGKQNPDFLLYCLNGGLSIVLVLLGGLFAGLTLAFVNPAQKPENLLTINLSYMGQDRVYLQVIAGSGTGKERQDAQKVLNVLQRGRHWVLVSLLLGNVMTNETLPIVLDADVKGGWFAVLTSTILIVIFGEIIPQSVCAKHGLAIGAWSSRYVLWMMYGLFPVAWPIARLLDRLLGNNHGIIFNRAGLKTLVLLHEHLSYSPTERLNREETTVISSMLNMKDRSISSIMTPLNKLYTLSLNTVLNDVTRYNILKSGYAAIPIHMPGQTKSFVGILSVKGLVALKNFEEDITVGDLSLDSLPVVRPDVSMQEVIHAFRDRTTQMVLVTERGISHGDPVGIVTARDVMELLIGDQRSADGLLNAV